MTLWLLSNTLMRWQYGSQTTTTEKRAMRTNWLAATWNQARDPSDVFKNKTF